MTDTDGTSHDAPSAGTPRRRALPLRSFATVWRRPSALPVAAGLVAAALLTTYTVPGNDDAPLPAASPSLAAPLDAAPPTAAPRASTPRVAPTIEGLATGERADDADAAPSIPAIADDDRQLTRFRSAAVPETEPGGVLPVDLVVRADEGAGFDLDDLDAPLADASHVAAAASITGEAAAATGDDDDPRDVTVLGVDAVSFRPLTPEVTAASDPVWDRLAEGEALVQHDLARELGLELGDALLLTTDDGVTTTLRIGALAANGTPPLADLLVSTRVARDLGHDEPDTLVVSVDGDLDGVVAALTDATGADVDVRRPPPEPVAPQRQGNSPTGAIESFSYTSRADGSIQIHGDWVARNIVRLELPGMPATQCHRVMVPQVQAAVRELIERGIYGHLDPSQFAGCFNARHIDRNPARPLSMHAWGLAIDFNSRDNPLGARPVMDPEVVEVFRRWGFKWGGDWRRPDGMHFELERIVSVN